VNLGESCNQGSLSLKTEEPPFGGKDPVKSSVVHFDRTPKKRQAGV
jgi:hypothetical protein